MPYLAFNLNDGSEFVFDLLEERLSLGRDPKNDIVIDNGFISSRHAEFLRQADGTYELVDLKSSNGTFVNGKRVECSKVKGGDRILFGRLESRYGERAPQGLAPAEANKADTAKGIPTRNDGRRGNTDSVPAESRGTPDPKAKPLVTPDPVNTKGTTETAPVPAHISAVTATASIPSVGSSTVPLVAPLSDDNRTRSEAKLLADKIDAQRRELADLETKIIACRNDLVVAEKDLTFAKDKAKNSVAQKDQAAQNALVSLKAETADTSAALQQLQTQAASAEQQHKSAIDAAEARVQALELREKELNQKLEELSATDGRLSNATEALKAVEEQQAHAAAQKATLVAAVLDLENKQQEHQRELTLAREQGTAQRLLVTTLTRRREEVEAAVQGLDTRLQQTTTQLQSLQAELTQVTSTLQSKQSNIAQSETKLADLQAQTATLNTQNADTDAALQELLTQTAETKAELAQLTTSTENLRRQHTELEAKVAEGSTLHTSLVQRSTALEAALAALVASHQDRSTLLEQTNTSLTAAETKLTTTQAEQTRLEAAAAELAERNQALEAKLASHVGIDRKLQATTSALTESNAKAEALRDEVAALTEEQAKLAPLRQQVEELSTELANLQIQQQQATAALQATQAEHSSTETTLKTLQADATSLAKLLTDKRSTLDSDIQAKLKDASAAEGRLQKARAEFTSLEAKRQAAETAIEQARTDEKRLKKEVPSLSAELATLTAAVAALVTQRESHTLTVAKLTTDHDAALRKMSEMETQMANLQEGVRVREDRLSKAQSDVEREVQRIKTAQDQARIAEVALGELQKDLEAKQRFGVTAKADTSTLETELEKRTLRLAELKTEEDRITRELSAKKLQVSTLDTELLTKEQKLRATEHQLQEVTTNGGKALSLTETIRELESRQRDAMKRLHEVGEQELALQAKINNAQEAASREVQRAEQLRKDALNAEADHLQKTASLEARLKEFAHHELEASQRVEEIRQDLEHFDQRQKELSEAETQVRRWHDVEKRLKDQIIELEEKHDIMRRELKSDQATVLMFAGDLIKRIDLIDILIQRYVGQNGGIDNQLRTLRASFEDILHQHGITEFDVAPETEIDLALRQRIAVIESESGNAKPRIVASYRPGFVYTPPEGKEVVLRKVEVKTTSR
jgi:hypothetical protein